MTTLLLVSPDDLTYVSPQRVRWRDIIAARMRAWWLDCRLAGGAGPDSSATLSLRAHRLLGRGERRDVSYALRRIVRDAHRLPHPFDSAVPVCRRRVLRHEATIAELASRLVGPRPVQARGVALARLLVGDGASPFYAGGPDGDLGGALEAVLAALEVELS